ncbi:MAG: hypothetical protein J6A35_03050 [Paludibacteraceae bacterium]|nr:hypothetical protein [Paludibacteraceae bacterium]
MNNLIQAITDYTTTLEQKLSALEARVAQLEEANEAMRREGDEAKALIATLQAEVAALAATGAVAAQAAEPEVEIELIVEEETESENEEVTTENEFAEEPAEKQQEEVKEELETLDIIDTPEVEAPVVEEPVVAPAPAPQPEATAEPVAELIVELAPQPEVKAEPVAAPQPAPRPVPQQTSLFGAAVEDIRQAISLGDRFLFQRELFAGNGELMQKTLDEINNLGSLNEAMDYVLDNFDWDKESTAVQLFENVLKRRFA